jgi:glutamate decarboxylase
VGQYYNFLRLGREGYTRIMEVLRDVAMHISGAIAEMGPFEVVSDGSAIPVLAFKLRDDIDAYTVFHVSDELRRHGWQVPAYTMPENATDVAVLRIVVREGFDMDLTDALLADLRDTVKHLESFPPPHPEPKSGFKHV